MSSTRTNHRLYLSVSATALALALAARAVPADAQTPPKFEQQVVVTPNRAESTIDRVPAFTTLVDVDPIEQSSARDVADLLRQTGVHVTDVAGNRRSYRVDLGAFGATGGLNTLVLVDGRRVNQPDLSGTDWSQIPLERVQKIEVIRGGGAAVLFGDSATGGVINIITRSGGDETVVGLTGGSYSSFGTEAASSGTRGRASYTATGRFDRSDGHRENSDTTGGDVGGQFSFRASDQFQLGVSGGYHGDNTGLPGALLASDLDGGFDRGASKTPNDFADVDDGYVMVTPRFSIGPKGYASLDFSVRKRNSTFFSSFSDGDYTGDTGTRTVTVSPKVVLPKAIGSTTNQFVAGVDLSSAKEDISNTSVYFGVPDVGLFTLEKSGQGIYVQDELRAGRTALTAGYRYDHANYTFDPSTPDEKAYSENAGSVGVTFAASKQVSLYGRVSRSFRYPVLDELFDFFGNTIQTGLLPQRSTDVAGGVRIESDKAQASVNVFTATSEDEIFYNPIGGAFGFGANENLDGKSHRTGVELAASARAGKATIGGTFTFVNTSVDGGAYDGGEVPGVPAQRASLLAQVPLSSRLSLGLEGLFIGERFFEGDFGNNFAKQESYFVVNTKVAWRQGRASLFLDIKNLFDTEYSEYGVLGGFPTERAYYPSPGIHAIAGFEFRF